MLESINKMLMIENIRRSIEIGNEKTKILAKILIGMKKYRRKKTKNTRKL